VSPVQSGSVLAPRGIEREQDVREYLVSAFNVSFDQTTGTNYQRKTPEPDVTCHYRSRNLCTTSRQTSSATTVTITVKINNSLEHRLDTIHAVHAFKHLVLLRICQERSIGSQLPICISPHPTHPFPRFASTSQRGHLLRLSPSPTPSRTSHSQHPTNRSASLHAVSAARPNVDVRRVMRRCAGSRARISRIRFTRGMMSLALGG
jgi:hypothetical protein